MTPFRLRAAARVLRNGGLVAYPTEAVYGLGCDPLNPEAVLRLLALKRRPLEKGLILIAAEFTQLLPYVGVLPGALEDKVHATWPGPVTWLLPVDDTVPRWLRGNNDSLAVRVTAHPTATALCRAFGGAIVSTSANIGGRAPARSALAVQRIFGQQIDCILHASLGGRERPTEIRDGRSDRIVRA